MADNDARDLITIDLVLGVISPKVKLSNLFYFGICCCYLQTFLKDRVMLHNFLIIEKMKYFFQFENILFFLDKCSILID